MLRNKKLFTLTTLVILIWGVIGYKIYRQIEGNSEMAVHQRLDRVKQAIPQNNLSLLLSYEDPFLKHVIIKSPEPKHQSNVQPTVRKRQVQPVVNQAPIIDWSKLAYYGLMSNASRKVKTGIVRFDNNDFFVREGETLDIFTVLEVGSDSIKMGLGNTVRYIKKEKNN
ncbi:hypothetical protein [Ohtaekwangia koreensis]|uniref:Type IV pilus biogenesis n=1 Tax=Ohtaekwangia koreensis TaxID=688867 RepID=A0A1T5K6S4_9BACT|nr:hypothetical protein [Ohtaekwangia koreensis]SKC59300.1 hypothetical protein SAMN05660236_1870 [Ohtaekwangia koreensis]